MDYIWLNKLNSFITGLVQCLKRGTLFDNWTILFQILKKSIFLGLDVLLSEEPHSTGLQKLGDFWTFSFGGDICFGQLLLLEHFTTSGSLKTSRCHRRNVSHKRPLPPLWNSIFEPSDQVATFPIASHSETDVNSLSLSLSLFYSVNSSIRPS